VSREAVFSHGGYLSPGDSAGSAASHGIGTQRSGTLPRGEWFVFRSAAQKVWPVYEVLRPGVLAEFNTGLNLLSFRN